MEIYSQILNWINEGKNAALATVIQKQGSALRGVGSKMAISSEMDIIGSVSGGCVEGAVVEEALKAMKAGLTIVVDYGITDEIAWSVGLACGGKVRILIQPFVRCANEDFNEDLIQKIIDLKSDGKSFYVLTSILKTGNGSIAIISNNQIIHPTKKIHWLDRTLINTISALEESEYSGIITHGSLELFADFFIPKPRLVIIGAVHVAIALAEIAHICGFSTIIIDPRKTFASHERFPEVDNLLIEWPTDGLEKIKLNNKDFLLVLSHDDKLDLPAIQMGLERNARYIGMLSSKQTRDARYRQLEDQGIDPEKVKRIHAPVGLDIGARTPEEIALSIMAEMTAFRYGKERKNELTE